MENNIQNRIAALRRFLKANDLQAFIIPSTDVHQSEYPPSHWKSREWVSGFTGSAGTVVVTLKAAGLWTDSRYFLQAEVELAGSEIQLFKDKLPETPTIADWLASLLKPGETVGVDGHVFSAKETLALIEKLRHGGLRVNTHFDPFAEIWEKRPEIPKQAVFELPEAVSGESTASKISRINERLAIMKADSLFTASMDTVAWIFNLRGNDVDFNPVFASFGYVSTRETVLFVYPEKIDKNIAGRLKKEGVYIAHYNKIHDFLQAKKGETICLQADKVPYSLYVSASANNKIIDSVSPADLLKACKNQVELQGFRQAMERDGVALVKFLRWLETEIPKNTVTEHLIGEKILEFRGHQDRFVGESFATIAGFGENGAIVHYKAPNNNSKLIDGSGMLLIDSGGQYFDGTTDITRTISLGQVPEEMKTDYTLVLKGHIALSKAHFPKGTRGVQLDILARQFLWNHGANYLHGTGHGIGHFLNVHEGPQSIRMEENPTALNVGMVLSNEPGIYRTGKHGVRIENLMVVQEAEKTEFGDFLCFETITICPIDLKPIEWSLMTEEETNWIRAYHLRVCQVLMPHLNEEEQEWLTQYTTVPHI